MLCWFWFIMAVMLLFAPAFVCRDALACDVTDSEFGPECGHVLAEVLKMITTLKYLNCGGECAVLRESGLIVAIACSVLGSLPLTRLRSDNKFGPKAWFEIVSSLKGNTSLETLDISSAFCVRVREICLRFTTVSLFVVVVVVGVV